MSTVLRRSAAATAAALIAGAGAALPASPATASGGRAAPIASGPAVDTSGLYAFTSPDRPGFVTFLLDVMPFAVPDGGPDFHPFATDATYRITVDNDGDARPDVTFRWTFSTDDRRGNRTFRYNDGPVTALDDENLLVRQSYRLEAAFDGGPFQTAAANAPVAPSRVGDASMPDYGTLRQAATVTLDGGWRIFAGPADDPSFRDLRIFDLLYGGDLSGTGNDSMSGFNVNTIALEVPYKDVALGHDGTRNPVIGVWASTERPAAGGSTQVSRVGNPLVDEVILPAGLRDTFHASAPDRDAGNPEFVARFDDPEMPRLLESAYRIPAPATPRADLAALFLTGLTTGPGAPTSQRANPDADPAAFRPSEQLRLNLSTPVTAAPSRLGVLGGDPQGFPNGRRLTDDVVDITLQTLAGAARTGKPIDALRTGDRVDGNDRDFSGTFPYVALPHTATPGETTAQGVGAAANPQPGSATGPAPSVRATLTTAATGLAGSAGAALVAFGLLWWRRPTLAPGSPAALPPLATVPAPVPVPASAPVPAAFPARAVGTARVDDQPLPPPSDPFTTTPD